MAQALFAEPPWAPEVCCLATSVAVRVGSSYEQEQNMAATVSICAAGSNDGYEKTWKEAVFV